MTAKTYEDGLQEGKIAGLEHTVYKDHKGRLDNHSNRLRLLERIIWGSFGIVVFMQFWPDLKAFLNPQ